MQGCKRVHDARIAALSWLLPAVARSTPAHSGQGGRVARPVRHLNRAVGRVRTAGDRECCPARARRCAFADSALRLARCQDRSDDARLPGAAARRFPSSPLIAGAGLLALELQLSRIRGVVGDPLPAAERAPGTFGVRRMPLGQRPPARSTDAVGENRCHGPPRERFREAATASEMGAATRRYPRRAFGVVRRRSSRVFASG
jgi:hypothetical protein